MKFSFFKESQNSVGLSAIGRGLTSILTLLAPAVSTYIGHKMLLKPRGVRTYEFDNTLAHREINIMTSTGIAHVNLFGSGEKIVLISHGWADSSHSFQQMILSLTNQGYLVAALDHIGHGKSSGNKAHLLSFIETMDLLLGKFHEERLQVEAIIGHSMGAFATLNLPRYQLQGKKIILISTPVNFFESMFAKIERFGISRKLTQKLLDSISRPYGIKWQQLALEHNVDKLDLDITFIHDRLDKQAPFSDIKRLVETQSTSLIETEGLGHSRILGDTNVIRNISQVLFT